MKEEINIKLDNLMNHLDDSDLIKKLNILKDKILADQELLEMIKKLKNSDIYSNEYKNIKCKLFQNHNFIEYKELENELNYLIMEMNQRLNKLVDKKECR